MSRIAARFNELKALKRAGFIPFITAGDPDFETSFEILEKLPAAGADIIELGVPFSDPMADGPVVQAASMRALKAGQSVKATVPAGATTGPVTVTTANGSFTTTQNFTVQ